MNRNVESHFALNPADVQISRSQFDRSSSIKLSGNFGECIPFYLDEVLPGDTFQVSSSKIVRLQTLKDPIMDSMFLDTYFFFVPSRLVWSHWKNFCGEPSDPWYSDVEYTIPKLVPPATGFGVNSVADYLGIPLNVNDTIKINALPFRAYAKICDDWFRDENLTDPLVIDYGDSDTTGNDTTAEDIYCANGGPLFKAAKYHDYFTSCLPAPLRGPAVTLPVASFSGVYPVGLGVNSDGTEASGAHSPFVYTVDASGNRVPIVDVSNKYAYPTAYGPSKTNGLEFLQRNNAEGDDAFITRHMHVDLGAGNQYNWYQNDQDNVGSQKYGGAVPTNLWTSITSSDLNAVDINSLRTAFQIQKFYERSARGGARYVETLKSQFGVTSPDASLQRSQYLGGSRIPINVHEVLNNSEGDQAFLGNLGAYSVTSDSSDDFVHSFTEHGFVIGICVARYDHTYGQGIDKMFLRNTKFDYYWPVFANIGEMAVKKNEIFFDDTAATDDEIAARDAAVFGYQEAWADYRYKPNRVAGMMRCEYDQPLSSWHLADDYSETPTLSDSWIREDPTNVDRVLQVTSAATNQFFADIYVRNISTRPMPMYSVPGLVDHN